MSVNLEVKGTLAKLLATEDIMVEHKTVSTASFNVKTRVLTLPRWERASSNVVDLLVSHEVGHALFTPNEDWRHKVKCPQGFVNVTEDARIEKLMKQKFGGLPKTFYRGYQELHDQDFFSIEDEDIADMNIADRVNLYFKIGSFVSVPFSSAEKAVVAQVESARTFDDALAAAEAMYALHKEQQEEKEKEKSEEDISAATDTNEDPGNDGEGEEPDEHGQQEKVEVPQTETDDTGENEGESNSQNDGELGEEELEDKKTGGGSSGGELTDEVKSMDSFSDAVEELASKSTYGEPEYITYPEIDLDNIIAPNKVFHSYVQESWNEQREYFQEHAGERYERLAQFAWGQHIDAFNTFKRNIQSEVNYMVKEFECKKSAAAYSRASTSRTGVLDCSKLHTYKYNDDIFKKITSLPEGKNHGLLFVLDWSGSMCDILEDTMKQLLSLVMFCDKVGIPFDVYAFTNEWNRTGDYDQYDVERPEVGGVFHIAKDFSLMNVLTSKVNRKELQRQMETMYVIASAYSRRSYDIVPTRVGLSGTPLNETLMVMREILPQFKAQNNVEKAHVMVLTDGEAAHVRVARETEGYNGESTIFAGRFNYNNTYIRNRKTGTVRKVETDGTNSPLTTILLNDLRAQFPDSTFTGFRILESRGGWFIRQATGYDDKLQSQWKKEKSIALTNFGYHKYYVVSSNTLQESADFEVAEDATKAKIKSAFAKSLKGKKNNKKILGDFIGLIA